MRPRTTTALYQTASRAWLTAAVLSLLLPLRWRLGIWLPLHLALAGAISTAISGAMQNFALALTATPAPPDRLVRSQFTLLTAGVGMIAIGMPTSTPWLTAAGGASFTAAMVILGWVLVRAWRRALNKRHWLPMAAYGGAVAFVLLGATLGALMGAHAVGAADYLDVKRMHMTVNVLGWASLTVVGTMITLLPTALRVRMPPRRGAFMLGLLVAGLVLQVVGWVGPWTGALAAGGVAYAAGALSLIWLIGSVLRMERSWAIPSAALHMMGAVVWFVSGSIGLAVALFSGAASFDRFREVFLTAFVLGWLIQVLLGAWSYLLPMARPGHPTERRRALAVFESGGRTQVVLLNLGLLLMAGRGAGSLGHRWGALGVVMVLLGGGIALAKAWTFPFASRLPVLTERARAVWGE